MLNGYNFHLFNMHSFHLVPELFETTLYSEECGTHTPLGSKTSRKCACFYMLYASLFRFHLASEGAVAQWISKLAFSVL